MDAMQFAQHKLEEALEDNLCFLPPEVAFWWGQVTGMREYAEQEDLPFSDKPEKGE